MKTLKTLLVGATVIGMSSGVHAQAASGAVAEEIVVTGRRPLAESVAAALAVQRNSASLVSVLSADAIGNLPDQNIAFAVGRLPGVAVERDQGQARYINLRGAPVYWTTLSYDGLSIVSPQGRDSRFDNIPSAIAKQIVVEKAVVPSMSGATVAGNVDIRTRTGFAIGGVSPLGHLLPPVTLIDRDLFRFEEIWAAAGHPNGVFRLRPQELPGLTGGAPVADVAQVPA
jgi:hypothetical protein